jgi:hypothetical protein
MLLVGDGGAALLTATLAAGHDGAVQEPRRRAPLRARAVQPPGARAHAVLHGARRRPHHMCDAAAVANPYR